MHGALYTKEQAEWIRQNASYGVFKDKKHFTAVFNAIFNENRTVEAITQYLQHNKIILLTEYNKPKYTEKQKAWLKSNYSNYDVIADMVRAFNSKFGTTVKQTNLTSYCKTLGIHKYDSGRKRNAGNFKKGVCNWEEPPVGTISYNKQRDLCFIKVKLCDGKSRNGRTGHNLQMPFWKPLQDKVWEDHYGKIPEGYIACSLNMNPYEQNIENIALINKRGKAIMGRKKWWSENPKFTATAVMWCNLWFIASDNGILKSKDRQDD